MKSDRSRGVAKRHSTVVAKRLSEALAEYSESRRPLLGLYDSETLDCLVKQIIDSIRRVDYVKRLTTVSFDKAVADPSSPRFDPLKAATLRLREGQLDDAVWLVFLAVHFGKHAVDGWRLVREVYGRQGEGRFWDWKSVSADTEGFLKWIGANQSSLRRFRFSNHRKYESLNAASGSGTGRVCLSFIEWIKRGGGLQSIVRAIHRSSGQDPRIVFDVLYAQMVQVKRFGRLAKFDFLTLLGKLGIAPILPGSAYIWDNATGPYRGLQLLVYGVRSQRLTRAEADAVAVELSEHLGVGLQEIEDAVCNWQKSPSAYKYFRG